MTLPLLISVPHAGLLMPDEVAANSLLTPREVAEDGDEGAAAIYDFADRVARHHTTEVARAALDQNRARDDRRKDGVVKTHTCWDVPIWRTPLAPTVIEELLDRYWAPYHALLSLPGDDVVLGVDCHTMAAVAPPVAPDVGQPRPSVCLSNADGTLPDEWFDRLVAAFERTFDGDVRRNDPFSGGYITRRHAAERPWVQLELSRAPDRTPDEKRERVLEALTRFCETLPVRP